MKLSLWGNELSKLVQHKKIIKHKIKEAQFLAPLLFSV
jgi:hypothetical protein